MKIRVHYRNQHFKLTVDDETNIEKLKCLIRDFIFTNPKDKNRPFDISLNGQEPLNVSNEWKIGENLVNSDLHSEGESPLPPDWKKSDLIKLEYTHTHTPEFQYCLTCFTVSSSLVVNGYAEISGKKICRTNCKFKKKLFFFGKIAENTDIRKSIVYRNMSEFSTTFKDSISIKLLLLAKNYVGEVLENSLLGLNFDVQLAIAKYLDIKSLIALKETCKTFNDICKDNSIWKRWYTVDFGNTPLVNLNITNWFDIYRERRVSRSNSVQLFMPFQYQGTRFQYVFPGLPLL
ncbi:DgyrCDS11393 [Dimorphilus gyrociliatus]|uniref:DgyrCDS11393 n=1 Tax=Dimorphilus gyrociliatus TaxID=2664684 RepID=A0A7I8W5P5_9ANNE|nr:DgyrCDS11393 [Dimorphilus gyrociliatus]